MDLLGNCVKTQPSFVRTASFVHTGNVLCIVHKRQNFGETVFGESPFEASWQKKVWQIYCTAKNEQYKSSSIIGNKKQANFFNMSNLPN